MQLSKLIIEPRIRHGWAAIDLGFVLGKLFWWRSVLLYLLIASPVFLIARLGLGWDTIYAYLLIWWCKPLFERPILFMLSRELFSEPVSFRSTLQHYKQWLWPSLGWVLTVRRLNFARGMYAPISLLERLPYKQYAKRAEVLGSEFSGQASWLTVVMYHVESMLFFAALALLAILWPEQVDLLALFDAEHQVANTTLIDITGLLFIAGIAPFYTAAGFILYISRRVELEGWDIEICFRDWMASLSQTEIENRGEKNFA